MRVDAFFTFPALGLLPMDGSEHTLVGRDKREDLVGEGARVGLFLAASLTVSMMGDDSREAALGLA